jgi:DNA-binding NarL/FixJ family response regulator
MRVLCVARHEFLSGHLCQYFSGLDVETQAAVGLDEAIALAQERRPDVVVCDYDLLSNAALERWERESSLSSLALIAVSLTRRPEEVYVDGQTVAGFLYLPTLGRDDALRVLAAARRASSVSVPPSFTLSGGPSAPIAH